jgi:hypothetical protein
VNVEVTKFARVCLQEQQVCGGPWTHQGGQQRINLPYARENKTKVRRTNSRKLSNLIDNPI